MSVVRDFVKLGNDEDELPIRAVRGPVPSLSPTFWRWLSFDGRLQNALIVLTLRKGPLRLETGQLARLVSPFAVLPRDCTEAQSELRMPLSQFCVGALVRMTSILSCRASFVRRRIVTKPVAKYGSTAVIAGALVLAHGVLCINSAVQMSATFDEGTYLAGGYSRLTRSDYRINCESGDLPQLWLSLPLLVLQPQLVAEDSVEWKQADAGLIGYRLLYNSNRDASSLLLSCRLMNVMLSVGMAIGLFLILKHTVGSTAATCSLALYAFCPSIIAHASVATSDCATCVAFFLVMVTSARLVDSFTIPRCLLGAVAFGALVLCKMSFLIAIPVLFTFCIAHLFFGPPRSAHLLDCQQKATTFWTKCLTGLMAAIIYAIVSWTFIWIAHRMQFDAIPPPHHIDKAMFRGHTIGGLTNHLTGGSVIRILEKLKLLPQAFLHGLAYTLHYASRRPCFLWGQYGDEGFAAFFPVAFLVKTPIGVHGLIISHCIVSGLYRSRVTGSNKTGEEGSTRRLWLLRTAFWCLILVYFAIAMSSHLNIGHRHILPIYPPVFALLGIAVQYRWRQRWFRILAVILLICIVSEVLLVSPNYLSFANYLVGGPSRVHRVLTDSSVDWGQSLPQLRRYLETRVSSEEEQSRVFLSYFGTADPRYHGLRCKMLFGMRALPGEQYVFGRDLGAGSYCISATMWSGVYFPRRGTWTVQDERDYQLLLLSLEKSSVESRKLAVKRQTAAASEIERLVAFLRMRKPDHVVGNSILVYHLTDSDIDEYRRKKWYEGQTD